MKTLLVVLLLVTVVFSQSHQVGDFLIPTQGYPSDSGTNWAVLYDSVLTHYARRNTELGKCSLNNVLRITGNDDDQYSEFLLRIDGSGHNDAGILLTPDTGASALIDFVGDVPDGGPSKRGRIGYNAENVGAALFVGNGGNESNSLQLGNRGYYPTQIFTNDICRWIAAPSGRIGIALDSTKYDSLYSGDMPQQLWVYGGGIRSHGGFYEQGNKIISSPWTTTTGSVNFEGNINSTSLAGNINVANGNVFLYGDPNQGVLSVVNASPLLLKTTNIARIYIEPNGNVTIYQDVFMSKVAASRSYADSAAAVAGGVTSGMIYHTNGDLKIMY